MNKSNVMHKPGLTAILAAGAGALLIAGFAVSPMAHAANGTRPPAQVTNPHTAMNGTDVNGRNATSRKHHRKLTHRSVQAVIAKYKKERPKVGHFFNNAYGYAVFPSVGKGGFVIGGAYGGGEVYKHGNFVGRATITKFDIGPQAGGQKFSEVIFFQNKKAFDHFTGGNFQFDANASAVGIKSGASTTNNYSNGVAIFTHSKAGLMAGAAIGGQKFSFTPVSHPGNSTAR